jgi:hypothetical protein
MREPLRRLRLQVYRRSIIKDIGVIEAIDELLMVISDEGEKLWLESLRAAIDVYRKHHPTRR